MLNFKYRYIKVNHKSSPHHFIGKFIRPENSNFYENLCVYIEVCV